VKSVLPTVKQDQRRGAGRPGNIATKYTSRTDRRQKSLLGSKPKSLHQLKDSAQLTPVCSSSRETAVINYAAEPKRAIDFMFPTTTSIPNLDLVRPFNVNVMLPLPPSAPAPSEPGRVEGWKGML